MRGAFLWYQERNRAAAESFRATVRAAIDNLAATTIHPAADDQGNRKRMLKRFPYSVIYTLSEKTVTIIAIAHHRRRPKYWR